MKNIKHVEVNTLVTDAYDNYFKVARVAIDEQGRKFYAWVELEEDFYDYGSIVPVSDFDDDHLA